MKICFENAAALQDGIALVAPDLGFEAVTEHAELTVTVCEAAERIVTVMLDGARATITYGDGGSYHVSSFIKAASGTAHERLAALFVKYTESASAYRASVLSGAG